MRYDLFSLFVKSMNGPIKSKISARKIQIEFCGITKREDKIFRNDMDPSRPFSCKMPSKHHIYKCMVAFSQYIPRYMYRVVQNWHFW